MTEMETRFEAMYRAGDPLPWDIGEPQPAVTRLADEGRFTDAVLDVGCGFGDNALFLASRGLAVIGVDIAPHAIELASERAADQGAEVAFTVADVTDLSGFVNTFDTVLDSALYHCLSGQARRDCVAALHKATRPGATAAHPVLLGAGAIGLPLGDTGQRAEPARDSQWRLGDHRSHRNAVRHGADRR